MAPPPGDGRPPSRLRDSVSMGGLDNVVAIAARLFSVPVARIRLVAQEATQTAADAAEAALCERALRQEEVLLVADIATDPQLGALAPVKASRVRFCAAAPLIAASGERLGALLVMDRVPRPEIGRADTAPLVQLATLAVAQIEAHEAQLRFADELGSRRLAEERLNLANDITHATLAAPHFHAAMSVCLKLMAEHIGADAAFARGLSQRSGQLAVEAQYLAPAARDLAPLYEHFRRTPVARDRSLVAETIFERRPLIVPDLSKVDARRFPLLGRVLEYGLKSLLSVPCENSGSAYSLTFLFRQPPADLSILAETVQSLTGRVRDLLARKQAEEQIELLQSVVLHTSDAVIVSEAGSRFGDLPRIIYVNPAFTEITGYTAQEVIGRPPTILRGPKSELVALERLLSTVKRREPARVEMHLHRKDATSFWAEIDATPALDGGGLPRHWIAVVRDRTERRVAEDAQREGERALRLLAERQTAVLDALPAHVALLDADGRIVSVSRSWHDFARACGAGAMSAGDSYFDFLETSCGREPAEELAQGVASVLSGRQSQFSAEYESAQDFGRRWYRLIMAPIASPAVRGAVAMHLDATQNKLAEEALRREKDFSEFLIRSTTEGILVFDRAFRITLWNPGIEAITGILPEQAMARNAFDVLPFLLGSAGETAMRGVLDGHEASFFDQRYSIPVTGRHGFYEAYFSPLMSGDREVTGGIGFLRETTERRRIEDALRQSQKMEAVGQLTGGIAHDFNNMLTVIAGNLELLEGKLNNEPRLLRLVASAALAASRAEKLTQQLLTFSRRQQLRPEPVDLNQIIIGMDDLLHRTVGETIDISTTLLPELWPALADRNQLETALINLVLNARDAMPGGGCITIETANVELGRADAELAPGAYAMLSISDSGFGMSEHVLAHVFEPFFTTKEVGKGTGLGLAQVYGFIKQSAGHVRLESREGRGTAVRLYLPRAEGVADDGLFMTSHDQPYRGHETVLVVEDDHGVREFAASVLRELGYRVIEASNGELAIDALDRGQEFDLLFTDVVMPGRLNGADLAREARQRRPELRILFTSGYTTRLLEKEWHAEEVEMLRKPYRSIDLAARVRAILDQPEQAAE